MDVRKRIVHGATSARENVPAGSRYRFANVCINARVPCTMAGLFSTERWMLDEDDVCTRSRPSVHI